MRSRCPLPRAACLTAIALSGAVAGTALAQQQPDLGVAAVKLADKPYTFDTAEQHGIRVSVVLRGVPHPFSVAFLPNGDALLAERGGALRLVHNAAGGKGGAATLDPKPVAGAPATGFGSSVAAPPLPPAAL